MSAELLEDDNEAESEAVVPREQLKPAALKPGAKVGLFAPSARPASPLVLKRCIQVIEEMGFSPVVGQNVMRNDGFTAGSDEQRLDDFYNLLQNNSVEAMYCLSGGYGALRLLPLLDFGQIRQHPKVFLGSGANDVLLMAINQLTGLVVFHASNLDEIEDKHSFNSAKNALSGSSENMVINCRDTNDMSFESAAYSLSERKCEGIVAGGNLTALSSLYGTRYQPDLKSKILILDDFNERNSILDRWFTTLYLAGSLHEVEGIAFGGFPGCGARGSNNMLSIEDTFGDRIKELGLAACFGFKFGLASKDNVVPIGIKALLDCGSGRLEFLEAAHQTD
ncbi:MAG: LD-carboxypeptidase [Candidatus Obscuribacterales bacterium]|nr:LD-carboxypeptidase [Candidatus Obscuribacterales bacterium]